MKLRLTLIILSMLLSGTVLASGAPWFKWQNTVDHTVMCSQVAPNELWVIYQGPFQESNCRKPGYPE
jgi:hypothetical protein